MIFSQVKEIIGGKKTQTRRVKKATEVFYEQLPYTAAPTYVMSQTLGADGNVEKERIKWQVGRQYAVVPKRGMPQVYWRDNSSPFSHIDFGIELAHETIGTGTQGTQTWLNWARLEEPKNWKNLLRECGWKPLYIELTDIRYEPLQDITEADAIAEGIKRQLTDDAVWYYGYDSGEFDCKTSVDSYRTLRESINGKGSWGKNPDVFVLEFKVVD